MTLSARVQIPLLVINRGLLLGAAWEAAPLPAQEGRTG